MRYRKKLVIYNLLAGLTALINSCNGGNSNLELIKAKHLSNFPSASTIEYNDGKIYLLGDDASYLLILDTAYNLLDTVQYMPDTSQRISKHVPLFLSIMKVIYTPWVRAQQKTGKDHFTFRYLIFTITKAMTYLFYSGD